MVLFIESSWKLNRIDNKGDRIYRIKVYLKYLNMINRFNNYLNNISQNVRISIV
jgi:hypothetical protein